ncbi:hypothetical protein CEK28_08440 [Xenophilus sp. AP218F]|nr:hypothetical protein CEK28_08440 [Xenophilus sp. AP218F]
MIAKDVIDEASILLSDPTNITWTRKELLVWLNAGQRAIVVIRPDACCRNEWVELSGDGRQELPAGGLALIDVVRNAMYQAVTQVSRATLDANNRDWHKEVPTKNTLHYVFDPRYPRYFYVFPRPESGTGIELVYSTAPTPCLKESDSIAIPDTYANALIDYMVYRAFSKAGEAANANAAAAYYQTFKDTMGVKTQTDQAFAPTPATTAAGAR